MKSVVQSRAERDACPEKRKAWIYEVPLPALHHLREALNAVPPEQPFSLEMLAKYDAPVLAGGIKLWALELDPPLALWEGWDDIRKLYPTGKLIHVQAALKTDSEDSWVCKGLWRRFGRTTPPGLASGSSASAEGPSLCPRCYCLSSQKVRLLHTVSS